MTNTPPCADRTNDPQDWFIRADGKQYTDDDLLTDVERAGVARSVLRIGGETHEEHEVRISAALTAARGNRRRIALARRRKAKDACWSCPMRLACLDGAMDRGEIHGTWGGYLEEELAEIRKEQARRRRRRGNGNEPRLFGS